MTTIHFYLRYRTTYGQTFFVSGNIPELGNGDPAQAKPIHYLNDELWHQSFDIPNDTPAFSYKYILRNSDGTESIEWPTDRVIDIKKLKSPEIQVLDYWNYAGEFENAFYTQPFRNTLMQYAGEKVKAGSARGFNHVFRVKAPLLAADETLCLLGSDPVLGAWDTSQCLVMRKEGNWYTIELNLAKAQFPIAYKYGVYNTASKSFVQYESGPNRMVYGMVKKQVVVMHDGFAGLPNSSFRAAGVAIPVFSLRTQAGLGVGEFADIKLLANWARQVGMRLIQLLPVNDTTANHSWTDSYPYAAISAFALHPMYINLEAVAGRKHAALLKGLDKKREKLNALPEVDYEAVMAEKWACLKKLYAACKEEWLASEDYTLKTIATGWNPMLRSVTCATNTRPPNSRPGKRTAPTTPKMLPNSLVQNPSPLML